MLKNLVKISWRNLRRDKAYSAMNVIGLTIGITSSLFLYLYVLDELSFDRYHRNAENIYRIVSNIKEPDNAFTWSVVQMPLADELRDNYPEVENVVRFFGMNRDLFKQGDRQFYETRFFFCDSTVFDMFSYQFLAGDPATALDEPHTMVLTESIAKKYFDSPEHALNQTLHAEGRNEDYKVTGVIRDVPFNSHFRFEALLSRSSRPAFQGGWGGFGITTYIQLPEGYDILKIYASLEKVVKEKVNPIFEPVGVKVRYELQRITDIHLHSKIADEAGAGGDISTIYIFSIAAAFMLIISCINYMNLATARSVNRAKEVGLRKVMGSQRMQLVLQFLIESVLITLIALSISLVMIYLLMPAFNTLANKQLSFQSIFQPEVLTGLLAIVTITGILGGSYPAFYLSGFSPVNVLKGKLSNRGGNVVFRRFLVIMQFGLSIFMLICTLIVFDQLQFLRDKDLGFNKENVVRLNLSSREMQKQGELLAEQLKRLPEVSAVGKADASPGEGIGKLLFKVEDKDGKMVDRGVDLYSADYDYLAALGISMVAGRNFSKDNPGDTLHAVLVNESMVSRMGWREPLGKKFETSGGPNGPQPMQVVGVFHDYNQNSLYDAIEPMIIVWGQNNNYVFVRLATGDIRSSMAAVEKVWRGFFRDQAMEYTFLDQDLDSQYKADQKRSQIFTAFSGLTIFIACLGLLGLAAYSTGQRAKEISIRKIVGATAAGLVVLVSREFFLLVGAGVVLAVPCSWYFTTIWLQKFSYHIQLINEWPTFLLSTILAMLITLLTVGFHVVRAAAANPVDSLRSE